ncbi:MULTISPECIES: phage antirepressor N-terminal domain-containing protein [unclassified Pseudomonas]|uniref:phage antirepressor N-terminal domain-containing protein n=1 Tax=unclassified Pseudomonas TaxID=196821 RepID=UPI000D3C1F67|nr:MULTISPECIES: phage antirepressor N-terminal domain-containing protein [unclassified Pseudomonas]RAU48783.1 hypothetical protein DBP26_004550 [Pseudomonas sp. RIT 409]
MQHDLPPASQACGLALFSNANKVVRELRDKIIQYQEECDEFLWRHRTKDRSQYIAHLEDARRKGSTPVGRQAQSTGGHQLQTIAHPAGTSAQH